MTVLRSLKDYGMNFQTKVISNLLKHKEFLQNVIDVLNPEEFDNPGHEWIINNILSYYQKYHTNPTPEYLSIEMKKVENEVLRLTIGEQLKEAYKSLNDDQEYIEGEFSNFCKNQQVKKALLESVDLLGKGQFDDIRTTLEHALRAGQDKNIGHEYLKDVETRYRKDQRSPIPTGWANIDELLQGGLGAGDLGLIFGNPGGGKSWMLVSLGAAAVMAGYNVCHYTLELSEDYIGKRYDSRFTNKPVSEIHLYKKEIQTAIDLLPGKLIIKEFPMGKVTITAIESHINKCINLGFNPDLIIIDYVDLLRSKRRSDDRKYEVDDIYTSVKGLAREKKLPIWTVSQVNRLGAKDDIIEADKAAGSYDKIMISDFAMSLSRKRQDKVNGTGRVHVMKNRYGSDGMTYSATVDTSTGVIDLSASEMSDDEITSHGSGPETSQSFKIFSGEDRKKVLNLFKSGAIEH